MIPLKLAWAVTIHKSQGMTLDYVKVDLDGVFTEAQVYVALSRASDENGLELRNFNPRYVKADGRALAFYQSDCAGTFPHWSQPWREKDMLASSYHVSWTDEVSAAIVPPTVVPGSLKYLAFVFTGEFSGGFTKKQGEALVRDGGGWVRSAVSGKTNYLVAGNRLEDGRDVSTSRKYQKAQEIMAGGKSPLQILTLSEFFDLVKARGTTEKGASTSGEAKPLKQSTLMKSTT
eukprot:CAMPEP_0172448096 /NCGR_PEP_ID=MMETSP1065-20121228/7183_1 /TAXON_ID=265537 /ORGANISM="Amphiprora paludosa, Strain CCMP125" /LENGTH=231 /DNA_ID=CAMNT_0013199497 /DNA_START=73 /DNA_END=768 /DNA_ORIENTATION=-